jgi:hypothetical protein
MYTGPTSGSIRASPRGQVPTGPSFHTVCRVVGRRFKIDRTQSWYRGLQEVGLALHEEETLPYFR